LELLFDHMLCMAALAGWGLINHHPPGPRPGSRRACRGLHQLH